MANRFAIVTGASTGIGFELAHLAAQDGYDVLLCAGEALTESAAADVRAHGTQVTSVEADLSTIDGVDRLLAAAGGRPANFRAPMPGWRWDIPSRSSSRPTGGASSTPTPPARAT